MPLCWSALCPLPELRIECRQQHSSYGVGLAGASVTSDQLSRVSKPATLARLTGDRIAIRFAEQNQDGQRGVRLHHRLAESGKASCVTQASPVAEFPGPRKAANSRSVKRLGKTGGSLTEAKCWAVRFPVGEGRPAPTEPNKNEIFVAQDSRKAEEQLLAVWWLAALLRRRHNSPLAFQYCP